MFCLLQRRFHFLSFLPHSLLFNIFISIRNVCMTFFLKACLIGTPSLYGDYGPIPSLVSILTGLQFIYLFVNSFNIYFSFSFSLYLILLLFFPLQPPSSSSPTEAEITAITLGAVLFLVLIGAVLYFLYKQDHICKSR